MDQLGKFTRRIEATVGRLLGTESDEMSEPLELVTGILREVERRVEPIGGGRRRFPFTRVGVIVLAERREDQDRCAAALEDLDQKIRERLKESACEPPVRLDVDVQCVRKPRKAWTTGQRVELQFSRDTPASRALGEPRGSAASRETPRESRDAAPTTIAAPAARIVIMRGTASKRTYNLEQPLIHFGRGEEHAEASGRTRRNDVAFLDDQDEINRTVARAQAHLRFDADRREFRVYDDGSSNGTRIVRNAEIITVTPHGPRGVRVMTGDILELGRARLRVEIDA